jgi:hypothetical protein
MEEKGKGIDGHITDNDKLVNDNIIEEIKKVGESGWPLFPGDRSCVLNS